MLEISLALATFSRLKPAFSHTVTCRSQDDLTQSETVFLCKYTVTKPCKINLARLQKRSSRFSDSFWEQIDCIDLTLTQSMQSIKKSPPIDGLFQKLFPANCRGRILASSKVSAAAAAGTRTAASGAVTARRGKHGHLLLRLRAVALRALDFILAGRKHQRLESFPAVRAAIFEYGHLC